MNLRSFLLTSVALVVGLNCNLRDPLAPYESLGNNCADLPDGRVGQMYSFTVEPRGGVPAYTWSASGLPPGLSIDPDTGEVSGIPTEEGTFDVVIRVTDGTGYSVDVACGPIVVESALIFDCEANAPVTAAQGGNYSHQFMASGGTEPYTWEAGSLPDFLQIDPNTGLLSGTVDAVPGDYGIVVTVTDNSSPERASANCDLNLHVEPGLSVDPPSLEAYPDNCVEAGSGIDIDQLLADGVIRGGDGSPLRCTFEAFDPANMPQAGLRGHGNLPNGITVNDQCLATGIVPAADALGAYVWIMTVVQDTTGQEVYVPYCAKQMVPHPGAYDIAMAMNGNPNATFTPGYQAMSGSTIAFGDATPDPQVSVVRPCTNNFCFFNYFFGFNALNGGTINAGPAAEFPGGGLTHAIRVTDTGVPSDLQNRFWVVNIRWDYCLYGTNAGNQMDADAENDAICGSKDLAKQNGDDSNFEFGLIVRPPDP